MATKVNATYIERTDAELLLGTIGDDNLRLDAALESACRYVDAICQRPGLAGGYGGFWYIAAATAVFRPDDTLDMETRSSWPACVGDWASIGTVSLSDDGGATWTALSASDWQGEPLNAALLGEPFTHVRIHNRRWPCATSYPGRPTLRLVGNPGWGTVPSEVVEATKLALYRMFKRPDAPFGVAAFGDIGALYVRGSDPDMERLLQPRMWRW